MNDAEFFRTLEQRVYEIEWRETVKALSGGAKQLAIACKFISFDRGVITLSIKESDKQLTDAFSDSLSAKIGIKLMFVIK
jgi:hypothetical protein